MGTVITKANLNDFVISGEFDIAASVRPEKGSKESKQVTLRFRFNNEPIANVIQSSLKDKRINWQVGARAKFNSLVDRSVVVVEYKGGKGPAVDPMTQLVNEAAAAGKSIEEYLKEKVAELKRRAS